ncbi:hypothetical protein EIP91_004910 [Steccherinum ochraceum]|uniref:Uncharacterized protein n=1 Tax=Steccherinum ochraceum TaxID=92696 RepID=A0A4R0RE37_9APHY|nr:hypothetical protein EIP91_004910 [Steccherinum ochraceum]
MEKTARPSITNANVQMAMYEVLAALIPNDDVGSSLIQDISASIRLLQNISDTVHLCQVQFRRHNEKIEMAEAKLKRDITRYHENKGTLAATIPCILPGSWNGRCEADEVRMRSSADLLVHTLKSVLSQSLLSIRHLQEAVDDFEGNMASIRGSFGSLRREVHSLRRMKPEARTEEQLILLRNIEERQHLSAMYLIHIKDVLSLLDHSIEDLLRNIGHVLDTGPISNLGVWTAVSRAIEQIQYYMTCLNRPVLA